MTESMFRALPTDRINDSISPDWSLDDAQVKLRLLEYGPNNVVEKSRHGFRDLIKDTLLDPMIWFLFATSILFASLAKYSESIIMFLAIIPIGGMDAFLHWRTQVSTRTLSKRLQTYTRVIREGKEFIIPTSDVVPGDLVKVNTGEYFPADGIIVAANNAQVDESSLTGEALPITKKILINLPRGQSNPLIEYSHWGFVGTRLLTGDVLMRVVYTGKETLYGEIIASVIRTRHEKTPLQKALAKLIFILIFVALAFCILLAIVRYAQGFGPVDAFLSAATLAVVALPDEFPMVFTFFLGVGIYRLAQKHALVRRAVSVENIGRVTCICTDKTGTLTTGRFAIAKLMNVHAISEEELLSIAALASRSESGDPLDQAILERQINYPPSLKERLQIHPFTEERKRETAIYQLTDKILIATKGAPETILQLSRLTSNEQVDWQQRMNQLAQLGYKIIACARMFLDSSIDNFVEPENGYEFLGLLAFEDPPRPEVFAAVKTCQQENIHVLMITGDHIETAKKIAHDIGLGKGNPQVMTAHEAETMIQKNNPRFLLNVDVIARAIPSEKFTIVKNLREADQIVAVTGDGVNDVPALREADIGIAMGERGTQSAREAASIILLDDNFGSIVNAINEGKQLFKNLQLSFKYLLMVHSPYVVSATIIPLLGFPLLYYPIHIVWIELFIHPTSMLVFQNLPVRNGRSTREKSTRQISFFTRYDWWCIGLLGIYTSALVIITYLMSLKITNDVEAARANAFTAVALTHIALTIGLSKLRSFISWIIVILSILMLLILVEISPIAHYFYMHPPHLIIWIVLTGFSIITVFIAYLCGRTRY